MNQRSSVEQKVPGLKNYIHDRTFSARSLMKLRTTGHIPPSLSSVSRQHRGRQHSASASHSSADPNKNPLSGITTVEEMELEARNKAVSNPFTLMYLGNLAALRTIAYYLVSIETICCVSLTVGLTLYWYLEYNEDDSSRNGNSLDFILLSFVVISPISAAIGMAFQRRERALISIAQFRTFASQLYLAHCLWDWEGGRESQPEVDWLGHGDAVLAQLVGIGDELSRFLTLPTTSRSRHRMTRQGRHEAARTVKVAYHLLESMGTQRLTRVSMYAEKLKKLGLPSGEISRLRQYERFVADSIEQLRMVKMYRTPQALRSLARTFTLILPPFYAPSFAQVAHDVGSLGVGIANGVIVAFALTGLFLSLEVLEDPFTAFLALDGIDCREEFEVLHFAQLIHTRQLVFPDAYPFPSSRRAALLRNPLNDGTISFTGISPVSAHLVAGSTHVPSVVNVEDKETSTEKRDTLRGNLSLGGSAPQLDEEQYHDIELGVVIDDLGDQTVRESGFTELLEGSRRRRLSRGDMSWATSTKMQNENP